MIPFEIRTLASVTYDEAYALQRRSVARRQRGEGRDVLYLLEHPHVITLGRNAAKGSLADTSTDSQRRGVRVVETDRGGDVTYHGPGQLVGYPILSLEPERRDIRRYVFDLEESLIRTLAAFSITGGRHPVHRGVWVADRKIASVGIRIARWVTSHGFALNVNPDLSYFSLIDPCGIVGCEMTSMARETGREVEMGDVKAEFVRQFSEVFGRVQVSPAPREEVETDA